MIRWIFYIALTLVPLSLAGLGTMGSLHFDKLEKGITPYQGAVYSAALGKLEQMACPNLAPVVTACANSDAARTDHVRAILKVARRHNEFFFILALVSGLINVLIAKSVSRMPTPRKVSDDGGT